MIHVLEYHLVHYRRTWRSSALSTFLLPLLIMVGFGLGVGGYVRGGVDGVSYLDWMVPGVIASTAVQTAIGEATWPVLSYFEWLKTYFAQAAAPLRVADILGGHLAFILVRVAIAVGVFLLVAAAFGTLRPPWAPAVLPIGVLTAFAVAAPVMAYSASVPTDSLLAVLMRFAVLPMSLFSGVFFPVESLPVALRAVAYALPLWHGVDLSRAATLGIPFDLGDLGQVLYLMLWCVAGWFLALHRFGKRLVV
jgi:lipooligosaccharide transport system permease protein